MDQVVLFEELELTLQLSSACLFLLSYEPSSLGCRLAWNLFVIKGSWKKTVTGVRENKGSLTEEM